MPLRGEAPQVNWEFLVNAPHVMAEPAVAPNVPEVLDGRGNLLDANGELVVCTDCERLGLIRATDRAQREYGGVEGRWLYRCTHCDYIQFYNPNQLTREERQRRDREVQDRHNTAQLHDRPSNIWNYTFKPPPVFHGKSKVGLFYGIENELEAVPALAPQQLADNIYAASGRTNIVYFKSDGSLRHGVEIVSQPMSFDWFDKSYPAAIGEVLAEQAQNYWKEETYDAVGRRRASPPAFQCGLHIHMSRDAFGPVGKNKEGQEVQSPYHLFKFLRFVYDNAPLVQFVAGREGAQIHGQEMCSYDRSILGTWPVKDWKSGQIIRSNDAYLRMAARRKEYPVSRYVAVNLQNKSTVELRVFRATTNHRRIRAYVQFCDAAFWYTKATHLHNRDRMKEISAEGFRQFVDANEAKYSDLQRVFAEDAGWAVNPE